MPTTVVSTRGPANRIACAFTSWGLSLALVPLLATATASAVSAGETPDGDDREPAIVQAEPSPDGRWVAVQSALKSPNVSKLWILAIDDAGAVIEVPGVEPTSSPLYWEAEGQLRVQVVDVQRRRREVRWFDPSTGDTVRTTRDRTSSQKVLFREPGDDWANVVASQSPGHHRVLVQWPDRDLSVEILGRAEPWLQLTHRPGVVFHSDSTTGVTRVFRTDLDSGRRSELVEIESGPQHWAVSPDGLAILVVDAGRVRVLSAEDGSPQAGPWKQGSAEWIQPADSRYLLLASMGHLSILDLGRDRSIELGRDEGARPVVRALPDGRFLVRRGSTLELIDEDGQSLRRLFPPPSAPEK